MEWVIVVAILVSGAALVTGLMIGSRRARRILAREYAQLMPDVTCHYLNGKQNAGEAEAYGIYEELSGHGDYINLHIEISPRPGKGSLSVNSCAFIERKDHTEMVIDASAKVSKIATQASPEVRHEFARALYRNPQINALQLWSLVNRTHGELAMVSSPLCRSPNLRKDLEQIAL